MSDRNYGSGILGYVLIIVLLVATATIGNRLSAILAEVRQIRQEIERE